MTKRTDTKKLGFARTQPEPDPRTATWDALRADFLEAFRASQQTADWNTINPEPGQPEEAERRAKAYRDARDKLIGTPAPNGAALAYKLAICTEVWTELEVSAYDGWVADGVSPQEVRAIINGGDDGAKAFLACYFDALALSDVPAAVAQPTPYRAARPFHDPEFSAAVWAAKLAERKYEAALSAFNAADDAAGALPSAEVEMPPLPSELTVPVPGPYIAHMVMTYSDGSVVERGPYDTPTTKELRFPGDILRHFDNDEERAAPLIAVWEEWQDAKKAAREAANPAFTAKRAEATRLEGFVFEAEAEFLSALYKVLAAPVRHPAQIAEKVQLLIRPSTFSDDLTITPDKETWKFGDAASFVLRDVVQMFERSPRTAWHEFIREHRIIFNSRDAVKAAYRARRAGFMPEDVSGIGFPVSNSEDIQIPFQITLGRRDRPGVQVRIATSAGVSEAAQ